MPRTDGPVLATARAQLRDRFAAQQSALGEYVALNRKVVKLEASMADLLGKQSEALGHLAELTDPATASQLTGSSLHAVREAIAAHRAKRGNVGGHTAAAPAVPDGHDAR